MEQALKNYRNRTSVKRDTISEKSSTQDAITFLSTSFHEGTVPANSSHGTKIQDDMCEPTWKESVPLDSILVDSGMVTIHCWSGDDSISHSQPHLQNVVMHTFVYIACSEERKQ